MAGRRRKYKIVQARAIPEVPDDEQLISRSMHWRFISCYPGDWLLMPLGFLEVVANVCYQFPKPRFIDPAIAYDAFKIRRLVEEATILAIRAASDVALPRLANVSENIQTSMLELTPSRSVGHGTKLSAERKFRMREQAVQKLARAYRLNEMACIVATARHAAALDDLAELVLRRIPNDPDANYVHLFHQKITPHTLVENTSLEPLDMIISANPSLPENWRTRAIVKMMKGDYEGAAHDLTTAFSKCQFYAAGHQSPYLISNVPEEQPKSRVKLAENEQPCSLRGQLLFLRGWAYLCAASYQVRVALKMFGGDREVGPNAYAPTGCGPSQSPMSLESLEAHKRVKALAKRSLRDIMDFLAELDYSPDLSMITVRQFSERTQRIGYGTKRTRHTENKVASAPCKTYTVAELFAATPPGGLPPYPVPKPETDPEGPEESLEIVEAVTAHPMLPEALHQLLLCHCLLQTSTTELRRHAYMVARLIRLVDGSPIFSPSESPARADWKQLTSRLAYWLHLSSKWDVLCYPEPIGDCTSGPEATERDQMSKVKPKPEDIMLAGDLEDLMSSAAIEHGAVPVRKPCQCVNPYRPTDPAAEQGKGTFIKKPAEDGKSQVLSERAFAIGEWVLRAPMVKATKIKKQKANQPSASVLRGKQRME